MSGNACNQERAMIISETVKVEKEKIHGMTNAQGEHIEHVRQKAAYPKRSNVVGLWRKREEAIRLSNGKSKEKPSEIEFEEKKEGNQETEHDSRQQDKIYSAMPPDDSKIVIEMNLEHTVDEKKHDIVNAHAPRRSNIRNSWRKKAPSVSSVQLSRPPQNAEKPADVMSVAFDTIIPPLPKSSDEATNLSVLAKRSGLNVGLNKRDAVSNIEPRKENSESGKLSSSTEKSSASANHRITESASDIGTSAFDELKSKWAKFGVQTENNLPSTEYNKSQTTSREAKEMIEEVAFSELVQSGDHTSELTLVANVEGTSESAFHSSIKLIGASKSFEKSSIIPQDGRTRDAKVSGSLYTSRALAYRKMGSKRFRSKYARKPLADSETRSTDDNIKVMTKNASANPMDSEKNVSNTCVIIKSPDDSVSPVEKVPIPSFPLDETIHNESYLHSNPFVQKDSKEADKNICRSFVPVHPRFRDAGLHTTASMPKDDLVQVQKSNTNAGVVPTTPPSYQDTVYEAVPSLSGSWLEDASSQKKINISHSSLSSRANRRLRDIRMRNQTRREEDVENNSKEITRNREPLLSNSVRRRTAHESHGRNMVHVNESTAFTQSADTDTHANLQLHSMNPSESPDESAIFVDDRKDIRYPLHGVVPDAKVMVPDEFVYEKDANVESFKTAYDMTSLEQIANDMREEASSLFGVDILNEGVNSAISNFSFRDIFQIKSPRNVSRRAPSPVEEVAIEVEYVADSE